MCVARMGCIVAGEKECRILRSYFVGGEGEGKEGIDVKGKYRSESGAAEGFRGTKSIYKFITGTGYEELWCSTR